MFSDYNSGIDGKLVSTRYNRRWTTNNGSGEKAQWTNFQFLHLKIDEHGNIYEEMGGKACCFHLSYRFYPLFDLSRVLFIMNEILMKNSPLPVCRSEQKAHSEFSPGLVHNTSMKLLVNRKKILRLWFLLLKRLKLTREPNDVSV